MLSNILLSKLDRFVETELLPQYNKGSRRKANQASRSLMNRAHRLRKNGQIKAAHKMKQQAQKLPAIDPQDPDYRRLKYCRYADDFALAFSGPKAEAEAIKQRLRTFLRDDLKLELSEEKTLVTHTRDSAAKFLGYEISTRQSNTKHTRDRNGYRGRSVNGDIGLKVPQKVGKEKCRRYMRKGKPIHRAELLNESDYTILATYQLEYRGIVNYYRLADNLRTLSKLKWVMEQSLTKTLAHKHHTSVQSIFDKYKAELNVDGVIYKGLRVVVPREGKKPLVATWGGISLEGNMKATLDDDPPKRYGNRTELVKRLLADFCELCGSDEDVEVHHVQAMRKLHEYPGRPKPPWVMRMIALRRKTLLLCRTCHEDVDQGRPLRRQTIELTEVKALRKRAGLQY